MKKLERWRTFRIKGKKVDTIILTPADFGGKRELDSVKAFDQEWLTEWNKTNARCLDGHVVEPFPQGADVEIIEQYKDPPRGEIIRIAMEHAGTWCGVRVSYDHEHRPYVGNSPRIFSRIESLHVFNLLGLSARIVFHLRREA
ncbi:MAG: hypothetical protein V1711_02160 [bacterium]